MSITVTIKSNYGQEAIYPACEASKVFAALAGTKTLTRKDIDLIKQLGYSVAVAQTQPVTL